MTKDFNNSATTDGLGGDEQLLMRARSIAGLAHAGQVDKLGQPYVGHCERVAARVTGTEAKVVAFLHDTLEKGEGWTAAGLRQEGFPEDIIGAVEALTHRPGETESQFLEKIARNERATAVKIADIEDNIQQAENAGVGSSGYRDQRVTFDHIWASGVGQEHREDEPAGGKVAQVVSSLMTELGLRTPEEANAEERSDDLLPR